MNKVSSMKLDRVTITGVDRTAAVNPFREMSKLSTRYPYVEWGVLASKGVSKERFPDPGWVHEAVRCAGQHVQFSLHVCGSYVRDMCKGNPSFLDHSDEHTMQRFNRVQLNFSCYLHLVDRERLLRAMLMPELKSKQFILQFSDPDFGLLNFLRDGGADVVLFFDRSGGRGKTPDEWPRADGYCGYAGGLKPSNLHLELGKIAKAAGLNSFWIDTETGVRTERNAFDFHKVLKFLEISKRWVNKESLKPHFVCLCGWSGKDLNEGSPETLKQATFAVFGESRPVCGFCPGCDALFISPSQSSFCWEGQHWEGDDDDDVEGVNEW